MAKKLTPILAGIVVFLALAVVLYPITTLNFKIPLEHKMLGVHAFQTNYNNSPAFDTTLGYLIGPPKEYQQEGDPVGAGVWFTLVTQKPMNIKELTFNYQTMDFALFCYIHGQFIKKVECNYIDLHFKTPPPQVLDQAA